MVPVRDTSTLRRLLAYLWGKQSFLLRVRLSLVHALKVLQGVSWFDVCR